MYGFGNLITLCVGIYTPVDREFLGVLIVNINLEASLKYGTALPIPKRETPFFQEETDF